MISFYAETEIFYGFSGHRFEHIAMGLVVPIPTLPLVGNVFCAAAFIANATMQNANPIILLCMVLNSFPL